MSAVSQLMDEVGAGRVSVENAARQLQPMLVPMVKRPPADTLHERYQRIANNELPPDQPDNSWQDVLDAYQVRQVLSSDQYYQLYELVDRPDAVEAP